MAFPKIEDDFEDVLGKAMRGLGLSEEIVAKQADLSPTALRELLDGHYNDSAAPQVAKVLNLNVSCLHKLARTRQTPVIELPDGIALHNTAFPVPGYEEMTINSYSIVPPGQYEEGFLIDAGASFETIKETRLESGVTGWRLFLTHSHPDHVVHYDELSQSALSTHAPTKEPYKDAVPVREGDTFKLGSWQLSALETPGHSPGGISYSLNGPTSPVVFVGDAIFCYSVGGVKNGYETALDLIRNKLLSLPDETILCPGHGPPTTVAFERKNNPFFA